MPHSRNSPPAPDPLERRLAALTPPAPAPGLPEHLLSIPQRDPLPPPRHSRRPLVLATGLAALAVAALVGTLPARHQVAFADVQRSMLNVKTASWRYSLVWNDPKTGRLMLRMSDQNWVRLSPATQVSRSSIQSRGDQQAKPSSEDFRDGRVNIFHSNGLYEVWPYRFGSLRKIILDQLSFSAQSYGESPYYNMMPWHSRHVVFSGREVLEFQRGYSDKTYRRVGTDTILVDPATDRFIRTEVDQINPDTGRVYYTVTDDQYRYNADVPANTFDIAPPVGKTVEVEDKRRELTLTPGARRQIRAAINGSNAAYRAGDFAGFAALWDFEYHRTLPVTARRYPGDSYRRFWQSRLAAEKAAGAQPPGRLLEPLTVLPAPYAYTRRTTAEPFPPSPPPGLVRVKAVWKIVRRDGRPTQHPVTYDLRREAGGYRIYRWDEQALGRPD